MSETNPLPAAPDRQLPTAEYGARSDSCRSKAIIRKAIETLLPPPCRPADLLDIFDRRATYSAIQSWRFGKAIPPRWAVDLLAEKLDFSVAPIVDLANETRQVDAPGLGWNVGATVGIGAWRAKEKAPDKGHPSV